MVCSIGAFLKVGGRIGYTWLQIAQIRGPQRPDGTITLRQGLGLTLT
jgi:hypothetical protein